MSPSEGPPVISQDDVSWTAIRAQGAGGQNVNKVASAIHLRFDVLASTLPEAVKARLLASGDQRVTPAGIVLTVGSLALIYGAITERVPIQGATYCGVTLLIGLVMLDTGGAFDRHFARARRDGHRDAQRNEPSRRAVLRG